MATLTSVTKHFPKPKEGFITTLGSSILAGAATVPLNSTTGLTNGDVFVGLIEPGETNQQCFTGTVDTGGNQITGVVWTTGSNVAHTAGVTIVDYVTSTTVGMISKGLLVEHNQDGTHSDITATSVTATGTVQGATVVATGDTQHRSVSVETIKTETQFDYIASGGVWSGDSYGSTLNASMTALVCYINGRRGTISAVTARAFTASKDTYVDVLNNSGTFSLVYTEVSNNAASPALAANSIRLAIIVTGAGNIANVGSVNQGQENKVLPIASSIAYTTTDSLGNLICPRDPNRKILGYRQITTDFSTTSGTATQITGLTCPVIAPTGRKIKVIIHSYKMANSGSPVNTLATIWDGTVGSGTQIGEEFNTSGGANYGTPVCGGPVVTPTSSSKTYNVGLNQNGGNTSTFYAKSTAPAYIMVELA